MRRIGLVAALIAGFVIFYLGSVTPKPAPANAPADAFSAGRAFTDVQAMGSVPHVLGSPANAMVRDYLVARMQALGLSPQIQRGTAFEAHGRFISGGTVENVIGVLPGRDRSAPALALMAHHDSVPGSPGAADDTAGVASILEVVRAIKTHGVPARDVMVTVTDGEEAGLLGARVFFDSPLADHVGYVINLETRGGGGRAIMFETADHDGGDIALYRRTAVTPESNALTVFIYQHLPNDTDFTVAKQHGKVGLNYAFIGRQFDYHSPSSTPQALDIGSLQHMGQQVLPTATALAFGPLPGRAPDVVYGNVLFGLTLAYPLWAGWLVLAGCVALIAAGAVAARRREAFGWIDAARGVGAGLYLIALGGTALELARRATGVASGWMEYRPLLARFPTFEVMMLAAALAALLATIALISRDRSRWTAAALPLVFGAAACLFGGMDVLALGLGGFGAIVGVVGFGRLAEPAGAWAGLLGLMLVAAAALQVIAPTAAYVIAWPLAAGCVSFAASSGGGMTLRDRLIQTLIAALALAWAGYLFHTLLQGLDLPVLPVLPTMLAALVLWPLASPDDLERPSLWPAGLLFIVSGVLAAFLHLTSPWTPRHPNAAEPVFVIDPAAHAAWRVSQQPLDAWTRGVLTAEGGRLGARGFAFSPDPIAAAPASYQAAAEPDVKATAGPGGDVTIVATPHAGAGRLVLALSSAAQIDQVSVNGQPAIDHPRGSAPKPYGVKPGDLGAVIWTSPQTLTLSLHTANPGSVKIGVTEIYDRWMSAKPLPPTPPREQMWNNAGSTYVVGQVMVQP
jgi:hypothetical protein